MTEALASENYLADVRHQYENLPYPNREPRDEKERLLSVSGDALEYLNHFAYGGHIDLSGFSVLVAGGGTGDASIFWAEQLRQYSDTRIVHLDMSTASINVAKQRAKERGLENIEFVHQSLLDLPTSELGRFNHINCSGVLHHLEDPVAGLRALESVLHEDGVIAMMVYGLYGRQNIYRLQELMRIINADGCDIDEQLARTKTVLSACADKPWGQAITMQVRREMLTHGDHGLYDMALHTQDRAYTVPQLYAYVESCGLQLAHWVDHTTPYCVYFDTANIQDEALRARLEAMNERERYAALELLHGGMTKHCCYVARKALAVADPSDSAMVPFVAHGIAYHNPSLLRDGLVAENDGKPFVVKAASVSMKCEVTPYMRAFLLAIDGVRTVGEVQQAALAQLQHEGIEVTALEEEWQRFYHAWHRHRMLLLRHASTPHFPAAKQLHERRL